MYIFELERLRKEAIVAVLRCHPGIRLEVLEKIMKNFSQDIACPDRESCFVGCMPVAPKLVEAARFSSRTHDLFMSTHMQPDPLAERE
jgi:hypothetical protein